jgi:hypothetical protein
MFIAPTYPLGVGCAGVAPAPLGNAANASKLMLAAAGANRLI